MLTRVLVPGSVLFSSSMSGCGGREGGREMGRGGGEGTGGGRGEEGREGVRGGRRGRKRGREKRMTKFRLLPLSRSLFSHYLVFVFVLLAGLSARERRGSGADDFQQGSLAVVQQLTRVLVPAQGKNTVLKKKAAATLRCVWPM